MWNLMARMLRSSLLTISIILSFPVLSQWERVSSTMLAQAPIAYSVDIQGNYYLGYQDGQMVKYDPDGNELINYSLSNQSAISLIEAQNNLRVFLFYFDIQQVTFLDRFGTVPKNYLLNDFGISFGMISCPSPDGRFWVVENNPQLLKKLDPLRQSVQIEIQVDLGDTLSFMRAYQNILIITDEFGIHVFDQFGAKINSIVDVQMNYFQIQNDQLVGADGEYLLIINPFDGKVISKTRLPMDGVDAVFRTRGRYAILKNNKIVFYTYKE